MKNDFDFDFDFEEDDYDFADDELNIAQEGSEEEDPDPIVNALLQYLNLLPQDPVKMIDFDRYRDMVYTAAGLKNILSQSHDKGHLEMEIDDIFNTGTITIQLTDLTVCNVPPFIQILSKADQFELCPESDKVLQLTLIFQSVLKAV